MDVFLDREVQTLVLCFCQAFQDLVVACLGSLGKESEHQAWTEMEPLGCCSCRTYPSHTPNPCQDEGNERLEGFASAAWLVAAALEECTAHFPWTSSVRQTEPHNLSVLLYLHLSERIMLHLELGGISAPELEAEGF